MTVQFCSLIHKEHLAVLKTLLREIANRYLDMYEPVLQSTFALLTRAHTANQATSVLNHAIANKQQTTNNNVKTSKVQMKMQKTIK